MKTVVLRREPMFWRTAATHAAGYVLLCDMKVRTSDGVTDSLTLFVKNSAARRFRVAVPWHLLIGGSR